MTNEKTDRAAQPKKPKKTIYLKQFLVSGSKDPSDENAPRKGAFIMATCAKVARDEFQERLGLRIISCSQTAESRTEAAPGLDFWKSGGNWVVDIPPPEQSPEARRYFELKAEGEIVKTARLRAGIPAYAKWGDETPGQRAAFEAEYAKLKAVARKE